MKRGGKAALAEHLTHIWVFRVRAVFIGILLAVSDENKKNNQPGQYPDTH